MSQSTTTITTNDEVDAYVRERVETIVITSCNNSSRMLHMRADSSEIEPVCSTITRRGDWTDKPLAVYPPCYHPICPDCVELLFDVEVRCDE